MDSGGVVIIGGGIVGSALASVLAQDGHKVMVIERSMQPPNRIQGEVLQPGGVAALRQLGLQDCLEDIGCMTITGFTIHEINGMQVPLHFEPGTSGVTLRNGRFMDKLRKRAQKEQNCTFIEASVTDVIEEAGAIKGVIYKRKGAIATESLRAALTVNCQGIYSPLRKINAPDHKVTKYGTFIGIEFPISKPQHSLIQPGPTVGLDSGEAYTVKFILTGMSTCYVNHINENTMRFGLNIQGEEFPPVLKDYVINELNYAADNIREPLMDVINFVEFVKGHTFGVPAKPIFKSGFISLGDALNSRHPITASGMTIGFKDILLWRDLLRDIPSLDDLPAMRDAHKKFLMKRKEYSLVLNLFARIMHDTLFPNNDKALMVRSLTMDYMRWNPKGRAQLTNIIGIVETRPSVLFYQVALLTAYTVARIISSEPWWKIPRGLVNAFKYVYTSCKTFAPLIWTEAT